MSDYKSSGKAIVKEGSIQKEKISNALGILRFPKHTFIIKYYKSIFGYNYIRRKIKGIKKCLSGQN